MATALHAARSYALIFRGQSHRWGCTEVGLDLQDLAIESHFIMIARPLELLGHKVRAFVALDGRSAGVGCKLSLLEKRLRTAYGKWLETMEQVEAHTQADGMRSALNTFLHRRRSYFDFAVLTRFDTVLYTQINTWRCHDPDVPKIAFAARCEGRKFDTWNCTSDFFHIVPQKYFGVLNASVGTSDAPRQAIPRWPGGPVVWMKPNECFEKYSPRLHVKAALPLGTGHGCFNAFGSRIGFESMRHDASFCWSPPIIDKAHGRPFVDSKLPDFSCCFHMHEGRSQPTGEDLAIVYEQVRNRVMPPKRKAKGNTKGNGSTQTNT